jgi:hypothetical protein
MRTMRQTLVESPVPFKDQRMVGSRSITPLRGKTKIITTLISQPPKVRNDDQFCTTRHNNAWICPTIVRGAWMLGSRTTRRLNKSNRKSFAMNFILWETVHEASLAFSTTVKNSPAKNSKSIDIGLGPDLALLARHVRISIVTLATIVQLEGIITRDPTVCFLKPSHIMATSTFGSLRRRRQFSDKLKARNLLKRCRNGHSIQVTSESSSSITCFPSPTANICLPSRHILLSSITKQLDSSNDSTPLPTPPLWFFFHISSSTIFFRQLKLVSRCSFLRDD